MMLNNSKMQELFNQFIKFGVIGVSNTLIHLAIYYSLSYLGAHYILAHVTGFVVSVLNAYYWNNKYVFTKTDTVVLRTVLKVFVSYGITFLVSTLTLFIMVHYIGISDKIAPIINLLFTVPVNFLLNKYWAFQ